MTLKYKEYIVNREEDFTENGIAKVKANLSVIIDVIGSNQINPMVVTLDVISLNDAKGSEMDSQREQECIDFVNKY